MMKLPNLNMTMRAAAVLAVTTKAVAALMKAAPATKKTRIPMRNSWMTRRRQIRIWPTGRHWASICRDS